MRLLLDAHLSGARNARVLRERGHDVRAADEERALDGCSDEHLLDLAAREGRIMVTFDVKDFLRILQRRAAVRRKHPGCLILVGIDHAEFGTILRVMEREIARRPEQAAWVDLALLAGRGG